MSFEATGSPNQSHTFSSASLWRVTLLTPLSTFSSRPSKSAMASPYLSTPPSYHARIATSLRALSSATSASCASCAASMPFIRGIKAASSALSFVSGTGVSAVIAVRAEAVEGNADAYESTVARTASGESCVGGCWVEMGEEEELGCGWKRDG